MEFFGQFVTETKRDRKSLINVSWVAYATRESIYCHRHWNVKTNMFRNARRVGFTTTNPPETIPIASNTFFPIFQSSSSRRIKIINNSPSSDWTICRSDYATTARGCCRPCSPGFLLPPRNPSLSRVAKKDCRKTVVSRDSCRSQLWQGFPVDILGID